MTNPSNLVPKSTLTEVRKTELRTTEQELELPLDTTESFIGQVVATEKGTIERHDTHYNNEVSQHYSGISEVISSYIDDGTLPQEYRLPTLQEFAKGIEALAPTYDVMHRHGWQPEVIFVPHGLGTERWSDLLKGHELLDDQRSGDAYYAENYNPKLPDNSITRRWDVVIMSGGDEPALTNMSRDGKHGPNARRSLRAVSELPNVRDLSSPVSVMNQLSPTEDEYCALQLAHLSRGLPPVDTHTWSFANKAGQTQLGKRSWLFSWSKDHLGVVAESDGYYDLAAAYGPTSGIRPTVRIEDV